MSVATRVAEAKTDPVFEIEESLKDPHLIICRFSEELYPLINLDHSRIKVAIEDGEVIARWETRDELQQLLRFLRDYKPDIKDTCVVDNIEVHIVVKASKLRGPVLDHLREMRDFVTRKSPSGD